ncbi:hypothetical protein GHT06_018349 [Daphnia sinensis]|uniref:Exonuclease domain-containing protein n=1 Tax=Daphnia sinensis TaxID=1820382 RepID=A0AAD5KNQ3_9CRUS|nr:hypothetical protein GHT06_018349 [Daphnia sinensis]
MSLPAQVPFTEINSLVFFDLETTGFKNAQITELSFFSIEKSQFLNSQKGKIPRVTNRLNMCINPSKPIEPQAAKITQMENRDLEHQSKFDDDVCDIILRFLNRLKKPVCVVAHNGQKFDFPVLKAEFARINQALPIDILCADSLPIFKKLEQMYGQEGKKIRLSYKLDVIYERFYGRIPDKSHEAEADVKTLLLLATFSPEEFFYAVQSSAIPLRDVPKSW